jgi:regulator of vacuolar morphogenesis
MSSSRQLGKNHQRHYPQNINGQSPEVSMMRRHVVPFRNGLTMQMIRERKVLLEAYLRSILTTKDDRWRKAYTFLDFLAVSSNTRQAATHLGEPSSSSSSSVPPPPSTYTPQSWLAESTNLQSLLRLTRSALLKRDALASMADASGSRSSGIEAKRLLKEASSRLDGLEGALGSLKVGDGEKRRREEVVDNLKVERENLRRMIDAGVRTNRDPSTTSTLSNASHQTMPGGLFAGMPSQPQPGRVFGRKVEETAETRPLEDRQLLQLQQSKMENQDQQLGELSKVLLRQRKMGEEIHQEIGEQTDMLEDIDQEVGKVGGKLQRAKRDMNKLG